MKKLLGLILICLSFTALATTVYKAVDSQGNISYSTVKSPGAVSVEILPSQTIGPAVQNSQSIKANVTTSTESEQVKKPLSMQSESSTNQQLQQKIKTVNQQIHQLKILQQKVSQASSSFQDAESVYVKSKDELLAAKKHLNIVISKSNPDIDSTATITAASQAVFSAEQFKSSSHKDLTLAQEKLKQLKTKLVNTMQNQ